MGTEPEDRRMPRSQTSEKLKRSLEIVHPTRVEEPLDAYFEAARGAFSQNTERALRSDLQVPHGAVNVHGHVHEQESPTPNRHVNVSVEQLNYRPTRLSEIRRLARRLVEGMTVPRHSTRARLNVVERVMP